MPDNRDEAPVMPWGFFVARVKMRLVQYFKDGADAHGAGHFDADDVCSVALLKNGPTRSHVDIQLVAGKNLSAWQQDSAEHALNKLARTFAVQLETLKRYRTGGEQKVTVEHVHVHTGGQAIVGNVSTGGGDDQKK